MKLNVNSGNLPLLLRQAQHERYQVEAGGQLLLRYGAAGEGLVLMDGQRRQQQQDENELRQGME